MNTKPALYWSLNMNFKILIIAVIFSFHFGYTMDDHDKTDYYIVNEKTDNGLYRYIVIEYNKLLQNDQQRLSQRKVFEVIGKMDENTVLKLAKKSIEKGSAQLPLHQLELKKLSRLSKDPLWVPVKNNWTIEDENEYSEWFKNNASELFNWQSDLFADCSDVGLLFRWAYAHDKKLPVANTLSGSGKLFGHFSGSAEWDKLPTHANWRNDKRFKVAMRYLFDNTYTHSIYNDLYPTYINKQYVRPGSVYMIIRKQSGHTQTLFEFDYARSGIRTLWGNEPASDSIFESWLIWEPAVKNLFGAWRWPNLKNGIWSLIKSSKMPGYSQEQYEKRKEFVSDEYFQIWVLSRLGMIDFDSASLIRKIQTVKESLIFRKHLTAVGATVCGFFHCDPEGADYDSYSTNSRDLRLRRAQVDLLKEIKRLGGVEEEIVQEALESENLDEEFLSGYGLTLKDFILSKERIEAVKADANLNFRERWGLEPYSNKKVEFAFLNNQLEFAINERQNLFDRAYYNCVFEKCDPEDSFIKTLNTSRLDKGLVPLGQSLHELRRSDELKNDQDFLNWIQEPYRYITISINYDNIVKSLSCVDPDRCTLYDVLWKNDSLLNIMNWKSQPTDPINGRWGL